MGGIVDGMVTISTSQIKINSYSTISREREAGILRPKSMSSTITTYILPLVTIFATQINPITRIWEE